ncbi:hypothetical protein [Desertivirga arenae]|uniref:hypothetical protein n=1 Tax=Desertivirga arenae TaxID=2810309 RepID=UPI001A95FBD6|nr:hypothetical protein [Pedobacter sp. SYSU D00823]
MSILKEPFKIKVNMRGQSVSLQILHKTETFDFEMEGNKVSMINNGDNSWSIVSGNISQEEANLIGAEIEEHFKRIL